MKNRRLGFVLAMALIASMSVAALPAGAELGGTVSGTVYGPDGSPLAGVEVFLADGEGGRHTCTDVSGNYEFTEVVSVFYSATGPAVAEDCENSKFLDGDGDPLVVANGVPEDGSLNFYVERLPQDHPGFFHQLKTALSNCYDGDGAATAAILDGFEARLDEALAEAEPKLSSEAAETYRFYAGPFVLGFISNVVCPQGYALILTPSPRGGEAVVGQFLAEALSEATGASFYAVVAEDARETYDLMCESPGKAVGLMSTLAYSLASVDCGVDASFKAIRFGRTFSQSQFVVPQASTATGIADLDGHFWAYSDSGSQTSYIVPKGMMAIEGVTVGGSLEAGSHNAAAEAVSEAVADFATTFVSPALPDNVKVLVESPPIPNDAVAFGAQFPTGLRSQVEAVLVDLADEASPSYSEWTETLGEVYLWQGISPATDADWDWFRTVLDAAGFGIDDL